jgi:amino acid transporter
LILAFKGFTTITNSGAEVIDSHHNIGRAIIISIALCIVIYVLVGFVVASNLSLVEIIQTKNYSLAAASRPILGDYGVWFTAILAMVATSGGIIASIFAVSRMLTMLTEMKLIPHSHFGMPGSIQKHALVYTIVIALILTTFFNLTRIAALGIIFYLIMDIAIHYGVLRHLRHELKANVIVLLIAILLDLIILLAFIMVKIQSDVLVIYVAFFIMLCIFVMEKLFLRKGKITKKHDHLCLFLLDFHNLVSVYGTFRRFSNKLFTS